MIKQAAVGAAGLYGTCPGESKIAEAWEASIDPGKRFAQLPHKIVRHDVKLAASRVEQELAPAERSQPLAEVGDPVDRLRCAGPEREPTRDCNQRANTDGRVLKKFATSCHVCHPPHRCR